MSINSIPFDIHLKIIMDLDKESILSLSCCSRKWKNISDKALEVLYKRDGHYSYADGDERRSPSECQRMNYRIVILAKKAWRNSAEKPIKGIQYKKIQPPRLGHPIISKPVEIREIKSSAYLLFSEEGSRMQQLKLTLKQHNIVKNKVEVSLKEFPREEIGSLKGFLQGGKEMILLTEKNSSCFLIFQDIEKNSRTVIDLKVSDLLCHSYVDGKLVLGLKSGCVCCYGVDAEVKSITLLSNTSFHKSIQKLCLLPSGIIAVSLGDEISLISTKRVERLLISPKEWALIGSSLFIHKEQGEIIRISESLSPFPVREGVKQFYPIEKERFFVLLEGALELWNDQGILATLTEKRSIKAATSQEGFIAVAFEDNEITLFEEKEGVLKKLPFQNSLKKDIHALFFSKTLELIVTTNEGSIFSFCPFLS